MEKKVHMIAGPNGAGKTTIALELMAKGPMLHEFINADEIARGLAPLHPESMTLIASKLMIHRLKELMVAGKSFAFETTASGTNYMKHLKVAKSEGYEVHLSFLWLSTPQQAVKRVAQRVKQGGHHVPEPTIIRRYHSGIKNLMNLYLPFANTAIVMDVSSEQTEIIARKNKNKALNILNKKIWQKLEQTAYER